MHASFCAALLTISILDWVAYARPSDVAPVLAAPTMAAFGECTFKAQGEIQLIFWGDFLALEGGASDAKEFSGSIALNSKFMHVGVKFRRDTQNPHAYTVDTYKTEAIHWKLQFDLKTGKGSLMDLNGKGANPKTMKCKNVSS
jgi:hypothetical protein